MAMTPAERLEAVFAEADERRRAAGLPEPSVEEIVACCGQTGEGDAAMSKFVRLDERTAYLETPEEREAYLAAARELGDPELLEMAERTVARAERLEHALDGIADAAFSRGYAAGLKEAEDEYLGRIALERLAAHEGEPGIPAAEVYAELGINPDEIEAMPEVELE